MKEALLYKKLCDHPEEACADDFYNEIKYSIDLTCKIYLLNVKFRSELYQLKNTCGYHSKMQYSPIILKITSP